MSKKIGAFFLAAIVASCAFELFAEKQDLPTDQYTISDSDWNKDMALDKTYEQYANTSYSNSLYEESDWWNTPTTEGDGTGGYVGYEASEGGNFIMPLVLFILLYIIVLQKRLTSKFMKRIVFILLALIGNMAWTSAQQVGINTDEPNPLAVLDIQNPSDVYRGVMTPRMTTSERDLIDVSNLGHANGLLIYNTDEDCFNYYSRTEGRWKNLCGEETGVSMIDNAYCNTLAVYGTYIEGQTLGKDHYISLLVSVSKAGTYQFSAIPKTGNGYYFSNAGIFLAPGLTTVYMEGMGTPLDPSPANGQDTLSVYINGDSVCSVKITVAAADYETPIFNILCEDAQVQGNYIVNTALSSGSSVKVSLTADASMIGREYRIKTNTVNGYSFEANGFVGATDQDVTLTAVGTPIAAGTDAFTLYTNSGQASDNPLTESCTFHVNVAARKMKIVGVGENNTYYLGSASNGMHKVINNTSLFSPAQDAACKQVAGFTILRPGDENNIDLAAIIERENPDIIIIQYNWTVNSIATTNTEALVDYVNNKKGVLILCSDGDGAIFPRNTRCQTIVRKIFDNNETLTATGTSSDNTQPFASETESGAPVLDGPYLNLRGKHMGRDAFNNFNFTGVLNAPNLQVIAWGGDNVARAFMHATKGFVFFGDGAPFAYSANNTSPYNYTMKLDNSDNPKINTYSNPHTYNAHLFCNIMAWAIDYAQRNRP